SKIVREQLQLVADRRKALRRRLRGCGRGGRHAPEAIERGAPSAARRRSGAVALLELLAGAAPAWVVAADLVDRVDLALRDVRGVVQRRRRFRDAERR